MTQTRTNPIPRDANVATLMRVAAVVGRSTAAIREEFSLRGRCHGTGPARRRHRGARVFASAPCMLCTRKGARPHEYGRLRGERSERLGGRSPRPFGPHCALPVACRAVIGTDSCLDRAERALLDEERA